MNHLRKPTKSEILVSMFPKIGDHHHINKVYELTGIKGYNSFKAICTYIRKAPSIPEESRVDIRIGGDIVKRVK